MERDCPGFKATLAFLLPGVLVLGSILLLGGCSRSPDPKSAAAPPSDLKVVFGVGGGAIGQWAGYTIQPNGELISWRGAFAEINPSPAGQLDETALRSIWNEVGKAGFFEQDVRDHGEYEHFIRVTAEGKTHETSWVPMTRSDDEMSALAKLYKSLQDAVAEKP